jgi:hypothetical protein
VNSLFPQRHGIRLFVTQGASFQFPRKMPFRFFSPLLYQLSYLAGAKEGQQKKGAD